MIVQTQAEMKKRIFEILEYLTEEKRKRHIVPHHVSRNEIMKYIQVKVDRTLAALEKEGRIRSRESMTFNNKFFEII